MKLTPNEFAKRVGVGKNTVYKWIRTGKIDATMRGFKGVEIDEAEIAKATRPVVPRPPKSKKTPNPVTEAIANEAAKKLESMIGPAAASPVEARSPERVPEQGAVQEEAPSDEASQEPAAPTPPTPPPSNDDFKESILKAVTDKFGGRIALNIRVAWKAEEDEAVAFVRQLMPGLTPAIAYSAVTSNLEVEPAKRRASIWLANVIAKYQVPDEVVESKA